MFLRIANLSLLILFPIAWFAPLLRAGILPLFRLSEISVLSGLQALWKSDIFLALIVTIFALFAHDGLGGRAGTPGGSPVPVLDRHRLIHESRSLRGGGKAGDRKSVV